MVEKLVMSAEDEIHASCMTPQQLADAIVNFASAVKYDVRDQAHLDDMLQSLTRMVVRCAT
ncbi:hypothetical protein [Pelagibacterium halotolerans]|uniref:hypothetical protein n=1 Tax=Pelagibacterium halotolerans TaxID=531813 RepID=UPI003850266F